MNTQEARRIIEKISNKQWEAILFLAEEQLQKNEDGHTRNQFEENEKLQEIAEVLNQIGIPAHFKGFSYVQYAIMEFILSKNMERILITKDTYPSIATRFDTTPSKVEKAIRYAIEFAWDRKSGDEEQYKMFKNTSSMNKWRPTNHEFIAAIARELRQEH